MERPTPIKDAAVHRLAKSITQLTLCQVTTSEVDDATKLLEKARQKLQGIQNIPSQRVIDLEAAIRQLRQIGCILDCGVVCVVLWPPPLSASPLDGRFLCWLRVVCFFFCLDIEDTALHNSSVVSPWLHWSHFLVTKDSSEVG